MGKKKKPIGSAKRLIKQLKNSFKSSKEVVEFSVEVHDIFKKRTIT